MLKFSLVFAVCVVTCSAFRTLVVFPFPGKSHSILGEGYVRHLLNAGHEVTYITAIPIKKPHQNLTQVNVDSNFQFLGPDMLNITQLMSSPTNSIDLSMILSLMHTVANGTINHPKVQELFFDTNQKFDAVIVEWMYSDLYSGFSTVFNIPLIWSSSMDPHAMILSLIDDDPNPAYTPDHMSIHGTPLNFIQRVTELKHLLKIKWEKWQRWSMDESAFVKAFGPAVQARGRILPSYEEVIYNGSIVLGNSHVSSGEPVRLPINYVAIGGYHIDTDLKPLPEDLQKIMDNAQNGVIYFSMGSMLKSKSMPASLKNSILKMFGSLKQTVLWKFEEKWENLPKNVHILEWAPQPSILAHPNCLLFITHGGLLSTTETLHYGVPIIGIPMFADQFINVNRAVNKGFALQVTLNMDTPQNLKSAIEEILTNPKYRQKVKDLSFVYHDRTVPPGKALVHAVEHVIKTRGALHLRSSALALAWYQKLYLDLLSLILAAFVILVVGLRKILKLATSKKTYAVNGKKKD